MKAEDSTGHTGAPCGTFRCSVSGSIGCTEPVEGLVSPIETGDNKVEVEEEEEMAVGSEEEDDLCEDAAHREGPQAGDEDFGEDLTGVINGERDWPRRGLGQEEAGVGVRGGAAD